MSFWIVSYLLAGFVLDWAGKHVRGTVGANEWYWDLGAIILWPVTLLVAIADVLARKA